MIAMRRLRTWHCFGRLRAAVWRWHSTVDCVQVRRGRAAPCSCRLSTLSRQAHTMDTISTGTATAVIELTSAPSNAHSDNRPAINGPLAPNTGTTKLQTAKLRGRRPGGAGSGSMVGTGAVAVLVTNNAKEMTARPRD